MGTEMVDVEEQRSTIDGGMDGLDIFRKTNLPVTLKFEEVVYKVKIEQGGLLQRKSKSQEKLILKGITGMVLPGEMLAMLGPSGSGKTTLLTALGGRLTGHLAGRITYNGRPYSTGMKHNTGFVTQDDILYPHLTVIETLVYTALLRLPRALPKPQKVAHAEAVIQQLGLSMCRHSTIGGPLLRGISGGERKRVSIGQEMLINPSLLFLDEPTSGLDSTTAQRIVSTLWELAKDSRTVVMTIHQPSSRLFYMFHKVLLLSEGNTLYYGKGSSVMDYFSSIGFAPSVAMNPADFLLDLANGVLADDSQEDQAPIKQTLVSAYKTHLAQIVEMEINTHEDQFLVSQLKQGQSITWMEQFSVLFRRGIKERKHESFAGITIAQIIIVAIICGLLWWKSTNLQDQVGLLFFIAGFWGFFPMLQAIFTFPQERMMLEKERSSGMYRLSSYFMALTLGDLPMELVLPTVFYIIVYWMAGLKASAWCFLSGLFVLLYSVIVCQGLGVAIGAAIMDQKSATMVGSVIMLTFLLAGGYYVQKVPKFISWIKYISIGQYTYKLLLISQFDAGETYQCSTNLRCPVEDFPMIKSVGLGGHSIVLVAMGIMIIGYRLIAYLALIRIGRHQQELTRLRF